MHRDDLINATLTYVTGACVEYNSHVKIFSDTSSADFYLFRNRVHDVVWKYIHGHKVLDGTCSDFECTLALSAAPVFKPLIENDV